MRKLTPIFFLSLLSLYIPGQVNLVPNPSFESYTTCPNNASQLDFAVPWFQPGTGTSDFFASCSTNSYATVPVNLLGHQYPNTGNNYSGIISFAQEYREYLEVPLSNSLNTGVKYFISYYVSLADTVAYTTSSIGAHFSTASLSVSHYSPIPVVPQVQNALNNYFVYNSWKKVSGSFYASGGESYLTIGDFNSIGNTNTLVANSNTLVYSPGGIYLYIDDVCVTTDSVFNENWVGLLKKNKLEDSIEIFPNPCSEFLIVNSSDFLHSIVMLDVSGVVQKIQIEKLGLNSKIDLSKCNNGIYYIKVTTDEASYIKKIVINH